MAYILPHSLGAGNQQQACESLTIIFSHLPMGVGVVALTVDLNGVITLTLDRALAVHEREHFEMS